MGLRRIALLTLDTKLRANVVALLDQFRVITSLGESHSVCLPGCHFNFQLGELHEMACEPFTILVQNLMDMRPGTDVHTRVLGGLNPIRRRILSSPPRVRERATNSDLHMQMREEGGYTYLHTRRGRDRPSLSLTAGVLGFCPFVYALFASTLFSFQKTLPL